MLKREKNTCLHGIDIWGCANLPPPRKPRFPGATGRYTSTLTIILTITLTITISLICLSESSNCRHSAGKHITLRSRPGIFEPGTSIGAGQDCGNCTKHPILYVFRAGGRCPHRPGTFPDIMIGCIKRSAIQQRPDMFFPREERLLCCTYPPCYCEPKFFDYTIDIRCTVLYDVHMGGSGT